MFNIGAGEMVFILIAALLVLGPQRLPELARGIGRFLREFRRQTDEVRSVVVREFYQMDQELQREPPPAAPPPVPELGANAPPSLPLPPGLHAPLGAAVGGAALAPAQPAESTPSVEAPLAEQPVSESVPAPVAASPGERAPEQEEPLPRFEPIPGTVARNAPKQS